MCQVCDLPGELQKKANGRMLVGLFFGYPECCIEWFVERASKIDKAILNGIQAMALAADLPANQNGYVHGFIPCPSCAAKNPPGTEMDLIENRVCSNSYPADYDVKEEFKNYVKSFINQ